MTRQQLFEQIKKKESFLCVGLDADLSKIPSHLLKYDDPIFEFNKQIIDATYEYAVAYKPNTAFYEASGSKGWESLKKTEDYLPLDVFKIADAKRGDIGNTSNMYASSFFEQMNFDAITVSPYMGIDSVNPFYNHSRKWAIILAITSNEGALDFQDIIVSDDGEKLFERVIRKSSTWGTANNTMYVIGATRPEVLLNVRRIIPDHFLLIPGIGAQGGNLKAVCRYGLNKRCGLLINSSRGIIYAGSDENFANSAANEAHKLQMEMTEALQQL